MAVYTVIVNKAWHRCAVIRSCSTFLFSVAKDREPVMVDQAKKCWKNLSSGADRGRETGGTPNWRWTLFRVLPGTWRKRIHVLRASYSECIFVPWTGAILWLFIKLHIVVTRSPRYWRIAHDVNNTDWTRRLSVMKIYTAVDEAAVVQSILKLYRLF